MHEEALAPLLRRLRLAADLTLEQLAEASGVSGRAISDMERGVSRGPRAATVDAIADGLGLEAADRAALTAAARAGRHRGGAQPADALALPRTIADFTGRRAELGAIRMRAARARAGEPGPVLLLNGEPGIGKTSLAVQAATELADMFPDGRFFLDLEGLAARPLAPEALLMRLIHALAPATAAFPPRLADTIAVWRSVSSGKRILIVLDNAADEAQVRAALPANGPALTIVTSRRMLSGLENVDRLFLSPMPEQEAVTLLGAITAGRPVDARDLRELARLCANLPLAIRVAGNRLAGRPDRAAGDLIVRMSDQQHRLSVLTAGELQVSAAFALSYDQLSEHARRVFRRLSLMFGSTADAATAAVALHGTPADADDALDELVELGLLQEADGNRVRFHDLLRLYADGRLREDETPDDIRATRSRLRQWLLDTAVTAGLWYEPDGPARRPDPRFVTIDSPDAAKAWLVTEAESWFGALTEAAALGEHQRVVEVAESLHWFSDHWLDWGRWHEVFTLAGEAAGHLGDDRLQATQLGYLSWAYSFCLGDHRRGAELADRAFLFARRADDRRQMAWARTYYFRALLPQQRYEEALGPAREAVDHFTAAGDREGLPQALIGLGDILRTMGRHQEALEALNRAITLVTDPATAPKPTIASFTTVSAQALSAHVHGQLRRWPDAVAAATGALEPRGIPIPLRRRIDLLRLRAEGCRRIGESAAARADLETARGLLAAADDEAGVRETEEALRELPPG